MTGFYSPKNYADFNVFSFPSFYFEKSLNYATSFPQFNGIKFLVMFCPLRFYFQLLIPSFQSIFAKANQFSLLVVLAFTPVISPGCQNSSLLVARGTLVSNCSFHEVKPHFCYQNGVLLEKIRNIFFLKYLAIMLKSRTVSNSKNLRIKLWCLPSVSGQSPEENLGCLFCSLTLYTYIIFCKSEPF